MYSGKGLRPILHIDVKRKLLLSFDFAQAAQRTFLSGHNRRLELHAIQGQSSRSYN